MMRRAVEKIMEAGSTQLLGCGDFLTHSNRTKREAAGAAGPGTLLDLDLHVLVQGHHEAKQAIDREAAKATSKYMGHVGRVDSPELGDILLLQTTLVDQFPHETDEAGLERMGLGVGRADVGKHVAAARRDVFAMFDHCSAVLLEQLFVHPLRRFQTLFILSISRLGIARLDPELRRGKRVTAKLRHHDCIAVIRLRRQYNTNWSTRVVWVI